MLLLQNQMICNSEPLDRNRVLSQAQEVCDLQSWALTLLIDLWGTLLFDFLTFVQIDDFWGFWDWTAWVLKDLINEGLRVNLSLLPDFEYSDHICFGLYRQLGNYLGEDWRDLRLEKKPKRLLLLVLTSRTLHQIDLAFLYQVIRQVDEGHFAFNAGLLNSFLPVFNEHFNDWAVSLGEFHEVIARFDDGLLSLTQHRKESIAFLQFFFQFKLSLCLLLRIRLTLGLGRWSLRGRGLNGVGDSWFH